MKKLFALMMAAMVCSMALGKTKEKEVTLENGTVKLPGILCEAGNKKAPIVVFVHGSGPMDKNETIGPNKPFMEIAKALAEKGISSYRYDKRTLLYKGGADTITYMSETVEDAVAAVKMLHGMGYRRIFVLGHSLGGHCTPLIALSTEKIVEGMIIMSGNTRNMMTLIDEQMEYIKEVQKLSDDAIDQYKEQMKSQLPEQYLEFDEKYEPREVVAKLNGTIRWLVLQGGHDYQVTRTDFDEWKDIFGEKAQYYFGENLDHLMRELPSMAKPTDYTMPGDVDRKVIDRIAEFIFNLKQL